LTRASAIARFRLSSAAAAFRHDVAVALLFHRIAQRLDALLDFRVAIRQVLLHFRAGLLELLLDRGERLLGRDLLVRAGPEAEEKGGERRGQEYPGNLQHGIALRRFADRIA
jgi:hypothetical protein